MTASGVITVEKVTGLKRADNASSLTIFFNDSSGRKSKIIFPRQVLADLLAGLLGMQPPRSGRPIDVPPIVATEVQVFENGGATGLAFSLEGGWVLPYAIPKAAIPGLKKTVADLELLNAETPGGKH